MEYTLWNTEYTLYHSVISPSEEGECIAHLMSCLSFSFDFSFTSSYNIIVGRRRQEKEQKHGYITKGNIRQNH